MLPSGHHGMSGPVVVNRLAPGDRLGLTDRAFGGNGAADVRPRRHGRAWPMTMLAAPALPTTGATASPRQANVATVKASPEAQLRLLELADLDAELGRLEHRRRGLPEHAELSQLEQRDRELRDEIATLEAREGDLRREQTKADADVEQVRSRIARDRARLDAGQVNSPRELENLQSEIESLLRRQSDLEDVELDVMERLEAAQARLKEAGAERAAVGDRRRRRHCPPGRGAGRDRRARPALRRSAGPRSWPRNRQT